MSGTVVTLVAPHQGGLSHEMITTTTNVLATLTNGVMSLDVLAEGQALDVIAPQASSEPALLQALRDKFQNLSLPIDIFVQPNRPMRRKKLLVADMDATIVDGETLDDMAALIGIADQIVPITERAMRGEVEFTTALAERMALFKGTPFSIIEDLRADLRLMPGAVTLVRTMAAHGARCVLASGGFDVFTGFVAPQCGFHAHFGNLWEMDADQNATGRMVGTIVDKKRKREILLAEAQQLGIDVQETITVGDGANDIPMLQAADVGVAFRAKPLVRAATHYHVQHGDLTALLYLQGYRQYELRAG